MGYSSLTHHAKMSNQSKCIPIHIYVCISQKLTQLIDISFNWNIFYFLMRWVFTFKGTKSIARSSSACLLVRCPISFTIHTHTHTHKNERKKRKRKIMMPFKAFLHELFTTYLDYFLFFYSLLPLSLVWGDAIIFHGDSILHLIYH